jgi:hypothetical protein
MLFCKTGEHGVTQLLSQERHGVAPVNVKDDPDTLNSENQPL